MKKMHTFLLLFLFIIFLGTTLRFYQLGDIPSALNWDEVSIGYNAYSLSRTGQDEYGSTLPWSFRSLDDYKQPVYIYLDVLPVAIWGLNHFSVRFPSALLGSLAILLVYFLVQELFRKNEYRKPLGLLTMFFFAISPWSIQFSRGAYEANAALTFIIGGVWLFLRGIRLEKVWYLFASIVLLCVSVYTYLSPKVFVPLLFLLLLWYARAYFRKRKVLVVILSLLFFVVSFLWLFNPTSMSRGQGVLFTAKQTEILSKSVRAMQYDITQHDLFGVLLHNRRIVYTQQFIANYLSHYNPVWLFVTGDGTERHHAPGMGNLHLLSLPFILFGMFFLLTKYPKQSWLLFAWLLLAPLPASPTTETPHAIRSLIFLPTWHIFEAAGIIYLFLLMKKYKWRRFALGGVALLYMVSIVYYCHQYFVHINIDFQRSWPYGYKQAFTYIRDDTKNKYFFSERFEQPYAFYLFYTQYDPIKHLSEGGSARKNHLCFNINNAYFGRCKDEMQRGDYYLSIQNEKTKGLKEIKKFNYADGSTAIRINRYE